MVISHEHRYLFVEIPLTGSWAIRNELVACYGGEAILHKHANYEEFTRQASADETDYLAFATVRNPLDEAVSRYYKLKTDHRGAFTSKEAAAILLSDDADRRKYAFIQQEGASFEAYFRQFHRRPFNSLLALSADQLDVVMRLENLQEDFAMVLGRVGLQPVRPVPVQNKTAGRKPDWRGYYTPAIIPQAKQSFGPFMRRWGYRFPQEWGEVSVAWRWEVWFRVWSAGQRAYLKHLRYNDSMVGKAGRALRARFIR